MKMKTLRGFFASFCSAGGRSSRRVAAECRLERQRPTEILRGDAFFDPTSTEPNFSSPFRNASRHWRNNTIAEATASAR